MNNIIPEVLISTFGVPLMAKNRRSRKALKATFKFRKCLLESVNAPLWRVHDVSEETRMSRTAACACAALPCGVYNL